MIKSDTSLYNDIQKGLIKDRFRAPPEYRFWKKVDKRGPFCKALGTRCWQWKAGVDKDGYGHLSLTIDGKRKTEKSHRFSWVLHYSPIPKNTCVLHRCDNPSCVNPNHLFLGTVIDNHKDMDEKRRRGFSFGEANGMAKLSKERVIEIYEFYSTNECSLTEVGSRFKVSSSLVRMILTGRIWRNLGLKPIPIRKTIYRGSQVKTSKLSEDQVKKILNLYSSGGYSRMEIARKFGVGQTTISRIVRGESWAHLKRK